MNDADGNIEERKGTVSVFNGPPPVVKVFDDSGAETDAVAAWLHDRVTADKVLPNEIGIFVRSASEIPRATAAATRAGVPAKVLNESVEIALGFASVATMHLAKGLEFRAVAVLACDDEVIPSQERIEAAGDESDLEHVYNTERHLLYVACTRARDFLLVTGVKPASEFLEDLTPR
jgi:hypothetical protein